MIGEFEMYGFRHNGEEVTEAELFFDSLNEAFEYRDSREEPGEWIVHRAMITEWFK